MGRHLHKSTRVVGSVSHSTHYTWIRHSDRRWCRRRTLTISMHLHKLSCPEGPCRVVKQSVYPISMWFDRMKKIDFGQVYTITAVTYCSYTCMYMCIPSRGTCLCQQSTRSFPPSTCGHSTHLMMWTTTNIHSFVIVEHTGVDNPQHITLYSVNEK